LTDLNDLLKEIKEIKKMQKDQYAMTAGLLRGWVARLSTANYDERQEVYEDMLFFAKKLAKASGVNFELKS